MSEDINRLAELRRGTNCATHPDILGATQNAKVSNNRVTVAQDRRS